MPTQNSEDYLRCIYKLQHDDDAVATSRIAAALGIKPPSVTDMVQRLADDGFVQYRRYGGVRLTPAGRRVALEVTRRHRLWEMFLVRTLNFSWDEVHDVADLLEHVTPPLLEARIDGFLGHPAVDPHGDPIPTRNGVLARAHDEPLVTIEEGATVTVARVDDGNAEALQMLTKHGIKLGTTLRVAEVSAYDGSRTVKLGAKTIFLSRELAATLFVHPRKAR